MWFLHYPYFTLFFHDSRWQSKAAKVDSLRESFGESFTTCPPAKSTSRLRRPPKQALHMMFLTWRSSDLYLIDLSTQLKKCWLWLSGCRTGKTWNWISFQAVGGSNNIARKHSKKTLGRWTESLSLPGYISMCLETSANLTFSHVQAATDIS